MTSSIFKLRLVTNLYMLNFQVPTDCEMHLYNNNRTPLASDNLTQYTESSATGYTGVRLNGSAWTVTSGASSGATATYAQQTFSFSAVDTIYGYFVTAQQKQSLIWSEIFTGGPFIMPSSGGSLQLSYPQLVMAA